MNYYSTPPRSDELWHYGIKGMRWGVRKYQNEDGSLTAAGKKKYYKYKDQIENARKYLNASKKARSVKKSQDLHSQYYITRRGLANEIYNKGGNSLFYNNGAFDYFGTPRNNKRAKRSIALADDLIKNADFTMQPKKKKKDGKEKTNIRQ